MKTGARRDGARAFTRTEAAVVAAVVVVAGLLLAAFLAMRPREIVCPVRCSNGLEQIGRAIALYRAQYDEWFPYFESRFATDSLTLLYPDFANNVQIYQCPSTEDLPSIHVDLRTRAGQGGTLRAHSWFGTASGRALALPRWSSYGYDNSLRRVHIGAQDVIAGDMDATWAFDDDSDTANHRDGAHLLYADGHVAFRRSVYCSSSPLDNVFAAQPAVSTQWQRWLPETDSWLRRP